LVSSQLFIKSFILVRPCNASPRHALKVQPAHPDNSLKTAFKIAVMQHS